MSARVLCVNLGSRTAKLSVVRVDDADVLGRPAEPELQTSADVAGLGSTSVAERVDLASIDIIAHRVVRIARLPERDAVPFDEALRAEVAASAEYDPLHTRPVLDAFDALRASAPHALQVAAFDAAFHRSIPDRAAVYGLPYADALAGWRKVGFHGLSYAYLSARAAVLLGADATRKLVGAHLGGGCSMCAIESGRSIETTMGFTPTDGLMMATRSGAVDVGLLLAYMREKKLSIDETEALVTERAGLLGLGGSADMRDVQAARKRGDARAALAYDVFIHRASAAAGAMIAALHGVDAIAFAGGIGERDALVRADVTAPFAFLGARIDPAANASPADDAVVSEATSRVRVLRIRTREDWSMALAALRAATSGITPVR